MDRFSKRMLVWAGLSVTCFIIVNFEPHAKNDNNISTPLHALSGILLLAFFAEIALGYSRAVREDTVEHEFQIFTRVRQEIRPEVLARIRGPSAHNQRPAVSTFPSESYGEANAVISSTQGTASHLAQAKIHEEKAKQPVATASVTAEAPFLTISFLVQSGTALETAP
jgi:hypothetical protein